ncbi:MAG: permease-like cell division protein FtsX [Clostridia bacterium]|nr:permease-like cell division protein FtsX [Clostridia bacterium]
MTKLRYLTKEGFRNLRVNKMMTMASITVLLSCLLLVGIAYMLFVNIETFIRDIESENVIMVFADTDITSYDYVAMGAKIGAMNNVEKCETIAKDDAYAQVLSEMDDSLKAYLESLDENPLPDAYKVTVGDMSKFGDVVKDIKQLDHVLRVRENSELARQMAAIRNAVLYISLGVIVLLLLVSLFIISNTIKVTMFSRRLEISIMKSVGATNSFIKWPFVVEGIIIGIIAGLLATGAVWGLYKLAMDELMLVFTAFADIKAVDFVSYAPQLAIVFVCIGVFTGVFGSLTSIRKYLKERKFVELED